MMTSRTVTKKRARCPVCQRKGFGGWMGDVSYSEDSPDQWQWLRKPKRNVKGSGPSATLDPSNPTGVVFKDGFYKKGESSTTTPADGDLKPRCHDGHKLAILPPEKMSELLRKADKVGRDWITIPE